MGKQSQMHTSELSYLGVYTPSPGNFYLKHFGLVFSQSSMFFESSGRKILKHRARDFVRSALKRIENTGDR